MVSNILISGVLDPITTEVGDSGRVGVGEGCRNSVAVVGGCLSLGVGVGSSRVLPAWDIESSSGTREIRL